MRANDVYIIRVKNIVSPMMMDYSKVVELLSDVQNENKANSVADQIKQRSEDPHFVTLLQHAIRDCRVQHNIRLAGVVVLSRVLSEKHSQWEIEFQIDCLLAIIGDPSVEYRYKQSLETTLTTILELSPVHIFEGVLQKTIEALLLLPKNQQEIQIEESVLEKVPDHLKTALLLLRSLLNSQAHLENLSSAIKEGLLESTINIKILITTAGINSLIALAQFWKSVIEVARGEGSKVHSQLLKWMARNQCLTQWVFQLFRADHLAGQFCYINLQSQLDHEHLSELKTAAANLHSTILMAIDQSRQSEVEELAHRHLSQVPFITNTITAFYSHTTLCDKYQPFVTSLLGVLILLVKMNPKYFATMCDQLLHIVVFPLLAISQEEQQLFADDPEEFNSLAEDCCDRQAYGILKTQAARLLEVFCDEIRGPAQYTIQHAIISIKVRLSLQSNISPESAQHFLPLEEALFVLAILSYRLSKHVKEINELKMILKVSAVIDKLSPLELARCFQFFAYNYQEIFTYVSEGQEWIYLALRTSIQKAEQYPTLSYAALDFMSNVIQNYFSEHFALCYMQKSRCNSFLQFKIFIKIISKHFPQFSEEGLCQALQHLLQVVLVDFERYQKGQKKHTMDISHSLQTVRKIAEKSTFLEGKNALKKTIWTYTDHLEKFQKIGTDDEIVKLVTAFVKRQGITKEIAQIYHTILEFYQIENFILTPYIVFMNEMAVKSNDPLSIGIIEPIFRAAQQLHYHIQANPTSVTDNLALANTLIVLQNIVAFFGDKIGKQQIGYIADLACKIIPVSDQPQDRLQPIILARCLNLLFLCHMHIKDERALKKLLLFQDVFLFRGHDLKVLTACLSKELFRESDIVAVTEMINLLITHIWKTNTEYVPQIRSKMNPSVKKKSTVIRIKKIADYELGLKMMTHPFDSGKVPEQQLTQAIQKMRQSNSLLFQGIIRSLPSEKGNNLRIIMSEVTIQGRKRTIYKTGAIRVNHDEKQKRFPPKKRTFQFSDNEEELEDEEEESPSKKKLAKKKRKEETVHNE